MSAAGLNGEEMDFEERIISSTEGLIALILNRFIPWHISDLYHLPISLKFKKNGQMQLHYID